MRRIGCAKIACVYSTVKSYTLRLITTTTISVYLVPGSIRVVYHGNCARRLGVM